MLILSKIHSLFTATALITIDYHHIKVFCPCKGGSKAGTRFSLIFYSDC